MGLQTAPCEYVAVNVVMDLVEAQHLLGLHGGETADAVRAAYRLALRNTHPDVSASPSATNETQRVIQAFALISESLRTAPPTSRRSSPQKSTQAPPPTTPTRDYAVLVDDETIAVDAPDHETFASLLRVGHEIGDVTYLDRQNHLLEVLLRTVRNDTLSLVITLQGRANESTEAFLTVEPLDVSVKELPTMQGISMLVAHHLNYQRNFG